MTSEGRDGVALAGLHLLAVVAAVAAGLSLPEGPVGRWDWYMQTIPQDLLRNRPLESLWYLHAQPPGYNALAALLVHLPGELETWIRMGWIGLGALLPWLTYRIVRGITGRRVLALAGGLLVAIHPTWLLYEAYLLYDLPTTVLVTASVAALATGAPERRRWLLFASLVAALVLTRSFFHLGVAAAGAGLVLVTARRWRPTLVAALIVLLVPTGAWYAKNEAQYGFFGASSWFGFGAMKVAARGYSARELETLVGASPAIDPLVVAAPPFSGPEVFASLGFETDHPVPLLSRADAHNVVWAEVAPTYAEAAWTLLRHDPGRLAGTVARAYAIFSEPAGHVGHLASEREELGTWGALWIEHLSGLSFFDLAKDRWGAPHFGGFLFFLLPLVLGLVSWTVVRDVARLDGSLPSRLLAWLRREPALAWALFLVLYTLAVGVTLEYGENYRFKLYASPLIWALALVGADRVLGGRGVSEPS